MTEALITSLTIFVLATFVGYYVITKIPPTLHTPLMSGTNAISGIVILGALVVGGASTDTGSEILAIIAVALASVNVFGGFLVTERMLRMFRRGGDQKS
ncbi:MAG: NAD(P) transhydrogenase subunit alpha [Miltoncostaeaceae bacterium]